MNCEENHTITIIMTYGEAKKLADEIDSLSKICKDMTIETPKLTELWNVLP